MEATEVKAIEWPTAKIGGNEYTLRYSYAANSQLYGWGFGGVASIPDAAWAAAMAGSFDKDGRWTSAGFRRWVDLADSIMQDEIVPLGDAVQLALKKAFPAATVTLERKPGPDQSSPVNDGDQTNGA